MATIPQWKLAQNLTAITATGQLISSGGVLSNSTVYNLVALIDELTHTGEEEVEDIRPVNSIRMNEVRLATGHAVRLTALKRSDTGALLSLLYQNFAYVYLSWVEGTETFAGYFRVGRYEHGIRGHGRQVVSLEFRPCDPGAAQVTYSTSA